MKTNTKQGVNIIKDFGDFGKKWTGKKCIIVFYDGSVIDGKINGDERFFVEFIDSSGRITYISKAYIKEIIPEE